MSHRFLPALLALLACHACPALAQASTALTGGQTDLNRYIDGILRHQLVRYDIPGASVALVGDGRVLHLQGYGVADRTTRSPVSAHRTLFGAGSVSKLLTWTAVMQLVGQGRLALDRDVNAYLDELQIPPTWPQPVTLAHLLTHTAGFGEKAFGLYARDPAALVPLSNILAARMPGRAYPPGMVSAYSNYGTALAGHIVARAAGQPFEQVIEERILQPLDMQHSTFRQPLPPHLAPDLATGYRGSTFSGHGWYQARPAAALRTTAADMAKFMLAHLQQEQADGSRILPPDSIAAMQQRQFANHPAVSGMTYGFQELQRGGQRILWQSGDTLFYSAALFLLPAQDLGLFVACNRAGVRHARLELLDAILAQRLQEAYRPAPPGETIDSGMSARLAGYYRSTRSGVDPPENLLAPFSLVRVQAQEPGVLRIRGLAMISDGVWVEQAPGVFRDTRSEETVVFREQPETGATWLFEGNAPAFGYSRLPWHATPAVQATLIASCALVFLTALLAWSLHAWRNRPDYPRPSTRSTRLARRFAGVLCTVNLVFLAGLVALLARPYLLLFGLPPLARIVLLLPWLSAILAVPATVLTIAGWRQRSQPAPDRLQLSLVVAVCLAFLWLLHDWRLL